MKKYKFGRIDSWSSTFKDKGRINHETQLAKYLDKIHGPWAVCGQSDVNILPV